MESNGDCRRATREQVAQWIINAWESLSIEGTVNTWRQIFGEDLGQNIWN
jgi:hypothetical protein